jgi:hypothetical protein
VDSWWQLGEGYGYHGSELSLHQISCPFCDERGKFSFEHSAIKRKPNASKALHFDTLKCEVCAGYVMVLWSAGEFGSALHDYRVLPWPLRLDKHPTHWPDSVGRYWLQAHRSAKSDNWDAAAVMARSALQVALRQQGAEGKTLYQEIDDLAAKGFLPPHMKTWAHELRELGNDSAHPSVDTNKPIQQDVRDVLKFVDFLLQYLYNLPFDIQQYRNRSNRLP